jgi:nucleoid-associated protein YgaU
MDNETAAFESAQPETEEEWEYGSESRGRILWGRIVALAIALVVAFLAGRATAGRSGISQADYDRVKGDLAAARAEIANQNVGGPKVTGTPTSSPSPSLTPSAAGTAGRTYVVRNGDTLRGLALKFYGDASLVDLIAQANHITDPTRVYQGMELIIPPKP